MNQKLYDIYDDYLETVARVLNSLEQNFGKINYISAKNSEEVPKRGFLDDEQKDRYNLHGIGITVDFQDVSIVFDFDFHSNNHFGFNAWQLERFTKINQQRYSELSGMEYGKLVESFQSLLTELEKKGEIEFDQTKNRYYRNRHKNDLF
jgi:hypothetical protein